MYEEFKKSLMEMEDLKRELAGKNDDIKALKRELSHVQDELVMHKEKVAALKQSELELSYYKSSFKSANSVDLNNEM